MTILTKSIIVGLIIIGTVALQPIIKRWIQQAGHRRKVSSSRIFYLQKTTQFTCIALAGIALIFVLGIGYNDIGLVASSLFAIIGIALFAQWSILSNVTASFIIFFLFPYRVGHIIQLVDGDTSYKGEIIDISLFHVVLKQASGERLIYPTNLFFQKLVLIEDGATSAKQADEQTESSIKKSP